MNTAFLDAQNLAWKIHHVESGFAKRSLLETYETERRLVASNLLDFDAKYAALFSQKAPPSHTVQAASEKGAGEHKTIEEEENQFIKTFKESCEFTSGYGVAYDANNLNWSPAHPVKSSLIQPKGSKLRTGRIMRNSNVTRVVDCNVVDLEQEIPMNGSFRIYIFAGIPSSSSQALSDFATNLSKPHSFYSSYLLSDLSTVPHHESHNPHSKFFTICTIFAAKRAEIEISEDVPGVLKRYRDHIYADDLDWQGHRAKDVTAEAHKKMGLERGKGGVIVVRPDGYVGIVVALERGSGTVDVLNEYFGTFVTKRLRCSSGNAVL